MGAIGILHIAPGETNKIIYINDNKSHAICRLGVKNLDADTAPTDNRCVM